MSGLIISNLFSFLVDKTWNLYHFLISKIDVIVKFYFYIFNVWKDDFATLTCQFNPIRSNSILDVNK